MEAARDGGPAIIAAVREASAAFMAEGAAMRTGGIGTCPSTLGPGSTALLNGVASATLDRGPMLAISGQVESSREQYWTHQLVDQGRLFAPVTKLAARLEPGSADTVLRRALRTATAERPGAVHLTGTTAGPGHRKPRFLWRRAAAAAAGRAAAGAAGGRRRGTVRRGGGAR